MTNESLETDYLLPISLNNDNNDKVVQQEYKTYKTRWFVLMMFTLLSLNQCNFWITFSTVAPMASLYYDSPIDQINLLSALGPLIFIPFSLVFGWSITRYGIRKNIILAASLVALGGIIRAIPQGGNRLFPLVIIGQALNASAGPLVMIIPTKLSAIWFPPKERTLSTAIGTLANFSGSAIGFLLALYSSTFTTLKYLLYGEALAAILILVAIIIHFPEKPPSPPSATSGSTTPTVHVGLVESWKNLFKRAYEFMKNPSSAILTITCAITSGSYAGWSSLTTEIVESIYTQEQAKWLGFAGIVAGLFGGIIYGLVHDRVHNFKKILLFSFLLNGLVYLGFSLTIQFKLAYWLGQLFNVVGGFLINGFYPIIYEAAVEVSYPIPEEVGTSMITILLNIFTFLSIMIGSVIPPTSLNWALVGCSAISFIMMFGVTEEYKRSKNDLASTTPTIQ